MFSVIVGVYNHDGTILKINHGSYTIAISLIGNGLIIGTLSHTIVSGAATFSGLRILSRGTFNINATSDNVISALSSSLSITNFPYNMSLTTSNASPRTLDDFLITVSIYGEDDNLYTGTCNITISENSGESILGTTTVSINTGIATFTIAFNNSGSKTLKAEVDSISNTISVNIQERINKNPLCDQGTSAIVCTTCVTNAILIEGVCQCADNSAYSNITRICECNTGYASNNNYCVTCANYFSLSEITGEYSSDLKKIIISFARAADTSNLGNCLTYLTLQKSISSLDPTCSWIDGMTLLLTFAANPPITGITIYIDPLQVKALGSACNLNVQTLKLNIVNTYPIPTPISTFTAPSLFSIGCAKNGLILIADTIGDNITYAWSASTSPVNANLVNFINNSTDNQISISLDILSECTLTASLTVTNAIFQKSSTSSKQITISKRNYLSIILSTGNSFITKASETSIIKARVAETCGGSNFTYTWSYLTQSLSLDFNSILSSSTKDSTLILPAYSLTAGNAYSFGVLVSDGTNTGSTSVTVTAAINELVIQLSRSNGETGTNADLVISSSVYDPDNKNSAFAYK